jgi:hypothetical protein
VQTIPFLQLKDYNNPQMMQLHLPQTLDEAVKICLLTMTAQEKIALKNTSEDNLIMFPLSLAKNIRELFGLWEGNNELIKACGSVNPDDASMIID